jgi:hypothetical protein
MTTIKKGGSRTVLPIQYFDPTIEYASDIIPCTMVFDSPATYQQVEVLNGNGLQAYNQHIGGSYQTITNPNTNRKVSVHSTLGRKIIRHYRSYYRNTIY